VRGVSAPDPARAGPGLAAGLRWAAGLVLAASLALLPAGCGGAAGAAGKEGKPAASAQRAAAGNAGGGGDSAPGAGAAQPTVRQVRVAAAESGRLRRLVAVAGTLAADQQTDLAMKVAGRLELMAVDLGSRVRRGQVVARLAQSDFVLRKAQARSALEQARALLGLAPGGSDEVADLAQTSVVRQADAQLRQARLTHERARSLFDQKLLAQADLDTAEAAYLVAEARRQDAIQEARNRQALLAQRQSELGIAGQQLTDSTLTAPFDGMIRERRAAPGDYVAIGQALVVLVRTHPLRLRLAVPEREAAGLRIGQPVALTVEGDAGVFQGRLARMSPAISEDSRTLMVEAEVPNEDGRLRPGAFARAEIVIEAAAPAILVPASALVTFAGIDKVLTVQDGRARELAVTTGRREGDRVEVLGGLRPGTPVVLAPGNLVAGEPVRIVR
jgi:RND family efflux transporter MFP subunit